MGGVWNSYMDGVRCSRYKCLPVENFLSTTHRAVLEADKETAGGRIRGSFCSVASNTGAPPEATEPGLWTQHNAEVLEMHLYHAHLQWPGGRMDGGK